MAGAESGARKTDLGGLPLLASISPATIRRSNRSWRVLGIFTREEQSLGRVSDILKNKLQPFQRPLRVELDNLAIGNSGKNTS